MADEERRSELAELAHDVAAYARYLGQIGDAFLSAPPGSARPEPAPDGVAGRSPSDARAADVLVDSSDDSLERIRADMGECVRCRLHEGRRTIVYGEGNPNATLMFVGEGPGADEDATGRPFVGAAGRLLDKIIEAIGFKREDVYIANVVKCRPPGNRKPERDEAATCEQFLFRQIDVIRPKVLVALGATPLESLLGVKTGITRARGTFSDYRGIALMPTFHPAYLLRDPTKKREVWEDMKKVRETLERLRARTNEGSEETTQQ